MPIDKQAGCTLLLQWPFFAPRFLCRCFGCTIETPDGKRLPITYMRHVMTIRHFTEEPDKSKVSRPVLELSAYSDVRA